MKLKKLITELKKYEEKFGDCEVVTYYDLPTKNPQKRQGSKIIIMRDDKEFPLETVSWENNI